MRTSEGIFECGDLALQRGGTLKAARIVYKTYGTLNAARDNVIVYPTSYSAQHSDIEWLVDVRHCLDPSRYFIVIPNMFTNGLSTSPSNYDGPFPEVTTYDNVTQQRRLINELFGVERVKMVYGWSMGAQQAYHWAALFGASVERIVVNCGSARTAPHNFVFLEGVRTTLLAARSEEEGKRAMGRIYAGWALSQTFYRRELWRGLGFKDLEDFLVRSWEAGFVRRDSRDLLAQLRTWQMGDISANDLYRGDLEMALAGIKARVLLMPSATDLYFQSDDNRAELPHLAHGKLVEIASVWGHRAGNPAANPEDAAFIDAQVEALLEPRPMRRHPILRRVAWLRRNRCSALLIWLCVLILANPLFSVGQTGSKPLSVGLLVILLLASWALRLQRKLMLVVTALAAVTCVLLLLVPGGEHWLRPVSHAAAGLFIGIVTIGVLRYVLDWHVITTDKVFGAVAAYVLIAFTFACLFSLLEYFDGAAFYIATVNNPDGMLTWPEAMYFSFTVLTSTGFGEITPVSDMARSLIVIEQVLGVMYVAFLVARLANLYRGASRR